MKLNYWLNYISRSHFKFIDLGIDRVNIVASLLGLLRPAQYVITVTGTNGKGTTCRFLELVLLANGIKVGVYTSPHILHYTERVRIQGRILSDKLHEDAFSVVNVGRGNISLSYFEFSTLSALYLFKKACLDVVILEVGVGGRLDATNVIDSDIAVITSIALDHTDLLGYNYDSIATEKAGIFRKDKISVVGAVHCPVIFNKLSSDYGSILFARDRDWYFYKYKYTWDWFSRYGVSLLRLPVPLIPLDNAATGLAVISCLPFKISKDSLYYGLLNTRLPGRFQFVNKNPIVILDVAHNPHAACYLSKCLIKMRLSGKVRAVVGMLKSKDIYSTLNYLISLVKCWYFAKLDNYCSVSSSDLANCVDGNAKEFDNIVSAWKQAIYDSNATECVLVFGSFYAISPIISLIIRK